MTAILKKAMGDGAGLVRGAAVFVLLAPVRVYRVAVSPYMPMNCRYWPSCSAYAAEAVKRHGPVAGGWLALRRILRCHPWGGWGYDPVPHACKTESRASSPRHDGLAAAAEISTSDPVGLTRR